MYTGVNIMPYDSEVIRKIKTTYSQFRNSEKRIADFVLADPNQIIYASIAHVAKQCNISETSVLRFCKAMGYNGFQDFKISLTLSLAPPSKQIHEDVSFSDATTEMINKVMNSEIQAIKDTLQFLDPQKIEAAINAISKTGRLEFYGVGGSGCVAIDAQHKFFRLGMSCIAYIDTHMQAMSASTMKKGDVIVGISHTGSTKDTVESLKIAREAGATTICITGGVDSPIIKYTDIALIVVSREQIFKPEPMSSRLAQLAIIDVLSVGVAMKKHKETLNNLSKTRKAISAKRF